MAASTRKGSAWSRIVPAIVGPRSAEQYLSSVQVNLKARKELYDRQILSGPGQFNNKVQLDNCEVAVPPPSQLSNICVEILGEMDPHCLPITRHRAESQDRTSNPVDCKALETSYHASGALDCDASADVNLPCTPVKTSPESQLGKIQPKDGNKNSLPDSLKRIKKSQQARVQSKSPPASYTAPTGQSKKVVKAWLATNASITPSRASPPIRQAAPIETPISRSKAISYSKSNNDGPSHKSSTRRPTPKASAPSSPIRSRLSTPRTNAFKRLDHRSISHVGKYMVKESSKRVPTASQSPASSRPIAKDSKKRRGVIMVRKDAIETLTEEVPRAHKAKVDHPPTTSPLSSSPNVFVVESKAKFEDPRINRNKTTANTTRECRSEELEEGQNVISPAASQDQVDVTEANRSLSSEVVVARLVEAFSDSDLGSLEMSDSDASDLREHIRLVFQGNSDRVSGNPFIFPCLHQSMEELAVPEAVRSETFEIVKEKSPFPCRDDFESTPVARVRRFSRPETPTPTPRSLFFLPGCSSNEHDALTDATSQIVMRFSSDFVGQNFGRSSFPVAGSLTRKPTSKSSSRLTPPVSRAVPPGSEVSSEISKSTVSNARLSKSQKQPNRTPNEGTNASMANVINERDMGAVTSPNKITESHIPVASMDQNMLTDVQLLRSNAALLHSPWSPTLVTDDVILIGSSSSEIEAPAGQITETSSTISPPPLYSPNQRQQMLSSRSPLPSTLPRPRAESLTEAASPSQFTTKARSNTIDLYLPTPQSPLSRLVTDFAGGPRARAKAGSVMSSPSRQLTLKSRPFGENFLTMDSRKPFSKDKAVITKPILPLRINKKSSSTKSKYSPVPDKGHLLSATSLISTAPIPHNQRVTSSTASLIPNWSTTTRNGALTPLQCRKLFNNSMSMAVR
ncbi:hypothetical protein CPB84DRAFT_718630 [Gymnopilus junonius]|uniref:Uncharacterized protein n=1 Tax=Gymnopilus junonius TaxID=109634 RepID=A0A9P5NAG7_GYMJU|nr:hypothetical protein CPB84DRAFT_718630 [Gymnopilus junonius]